MSERSSSPPPLPSVEGRFYVAPLVASNSTPVQAPAQSTPFLISVLSAFGGITAIAGCLFLFKIAIIKPVLLPPTVVMESPESQPEAVDSPNLPRTTSTPPLPVMPPLPSMEEPPPPPPTYTTVISTNQLLSEASWTLDTLEEIAELEAEELERQRLEEQRLAKLEAERIEREKREAAERAAKRARQAEIAAREKAARDSRNRELAAQRQAEKERQAALAKQQADQRRQATLAKKVASQPSVTKRVPPSYPTSARRSGAEGTTRVSFTVTSSGKVSSPRVSASSGHRSLDSAAIKAVKKWRFSPARNGLGQPIAYQINSHPVTFRLN